MSKTKFFDLSACGIPTEVQILGDLEVLLSEEKSPVVFLIDEYHDPVCILQNIQNSKELIQKCGITLAGVESHTGGYEWDDLLRHAYTDKFNRGDNPDAVNDYPQFAEEVKSMGVCVRGVECQGLANELECDLYDNPPPPPIKDRELNVARSKHFIRTLFKMREHNGFSGNMILNVGGNHNTHIAQWVSEGTIETIVECKASYVRLRPPAYLEIDL